MPAFEALCRWTDASMANDSGRLLALGIVAPVSGVAIFGEWWWVPYGLFAAIALAFAAWRAWRLFKTGIIGSDKADWIEPR